MLAESTYYLTTLSNPALALRFWDGGYSLVGALLGMLLAAWAAEKLLRVPRRLLMDGLALALPAGILVCLLYTSHPPHTGPHPALHHRRRRKAADAHGAYGYGLSP